MAFSAVQPPSFEGGFDGPNRLQPNLHQLPSLPPDAQAASNLSNLINVSPATIKKLSANFDEKTKELAAFLLSDIAGLAVSYEQASEFAMLVLRDVYKVNTSIRSEVPQLLGFVSICGMIAKAADSMQAVPKAVRSFIAQEFISRLAERAVSKLPISEVPNVPTDSRNSMLTTNLKSMPDRLFRKSRRG